MPQAKLPDAVGNRHEDKRHQRGKPDHRARLAPQQVIGFRFELRQHIFKEDNVLFQMADQRLPAEVKTELTKGFERIEEEKVGAGKHEAFHRMLEELGKVYG